MERTTPESRGHLVSKILASSWRTASAEPLEISESELDEVTPLLYGSGAAGLGWWRLRNTELENTPSAVVLKQAYQLQALQAAIHEEKIRKVFGLLHSASVDPILAKGWAAAALYPDSALRPYGDIDLLVRPKEFSIAKEVLDGPEAKDCWVDLHNSFFEIDDRSIDELFARSQIADLEDQRIRVLSAEDHLALLSIHLLKHGAWRPLWLCDIGAAVERTSESFNWELCLGHNKTRANWILCAIELAHRLLRADTDRLPVARKAGEVPTWLVDSVLKHWAAPFAPNQPPMKHPVPMRMQLKSARGLWKGMRERWPDPIIATVSINARFNGLPRFPYQLGNCVQRVVRFVFGQKHVGATQAEPS